MLARTASARSLARLDLAVWVLIYGGLFGIVLGVAMQGASLGAAWSLGVLGVLAVAAGVVVFWMRSRMTEEGDPGAQSKQGKGNP